MYPLWDQIKAFMQSISGIVHKQADMLDRTTATANEAHETALYSRKRIDGKMDAVNPTGTGAVSFGRYMEDTEAYPIGKNSIAIGERSFATSEGSVAIGDGAFSNADHSCAIGNSAKTDGVYSVAIGLDAETGGYAGNAVAIGSRALAEGGSSFAIGTHAKAQSKYQIVMGILNKYDSTEQYYERGKYLYILGNGDFETGNSNAMTIDWNGNAWFQGDVYVGGTGQDDENASKLIAQKDIGDGLEVVDGKLKVKGAALLSEGKLRQYAALFNGSEDIESFLFFTDPHLINKTTLAEIRNNVMNDLQSIRDYYAGTPTSFVLCTGDWIDDDYDGDEACFLLGIVRGLWKRWFDDGCFAVGNHEYNDCGTQLLDVNTVHNLLLPHKENNYYAYDGNKTKFYVLDTGLLGYDHTEYGWEQIDWLAGKLIEDNAEHSAIASHIWYITGTDGTLVLTPFADAVLQLAQAYNGRTTITLNEKAYDFTAATGYVEFVIGGHKHVDKTAEEYGIPVIISTNVTINGHGNPTFDLVFADYTNRKIDFVRIGAYSNRTVQLADRGSGDVTYTNLVPTAVSPVADEVYNGVGYKNNTIRSGSADRNYEGEKDGYVLTGIIDCYIKMTNWKTLPTIYVKGNIETDETEYSSVALWMDGKVRKGTLSFIREMNPQSGFIVERLADGYYKMTPTVRDDGKLAILVGMGSGDVTGIQINLKGTGEGLIVTVDEPIE